MKPAIICFKVFVPNLSKTQSGREKLNSARRNYLVRGIRRPKEWMSEGLVKAGGRFDAARPSSVLFYLNEARTMDRELYWKLSQLEYLS